MLNDEQDAFGHESEDYFKGFGGALILQGYEKAWMVIMILGGIAGASVVIVENALR